MSAETQSWGQNNSQFSVSFALAYTVKLTSYYPPPQTDNLFRLKLPSFLQSVARIYASFVAIFVSQHNTFCEVDRPTLETKLLIHFPPRLHAKYDENLLGISILKSSFFFKPIRMVQGL